MGKLMIDDTMEQLKINGAGHFDFSAVRIEDLGATEYTLVTIALDRSGSVEPFKAELLKAIRSIVEACKKSPRAENLMLRILQFNSDVEEIHGFRLLSTIDPAQYAEPETGGYTALYDAAFSGLGATLTYAKKLADQDYNVNGICFVITDGMDNASKTTPAMIGDLVNKAVVGECGIEAMTTVLVGLNTADTEVHSKLELFSRDACLTQYVDAGNATPERLARLAAFVSKSISTQSQALGTGGASQVLTF